MTPEKTEAYLLRTTPYGESDLVVVMLTRQHGRVSVLARGARKSRRRFGGALDYFHLLEAHVRPGRSGLGRLSSVELLRAFRTVQNGVDAYLVGSQVLELARLGSRDGDPDEGLFHLVDATLNALDQGVHPGSVLRVYQTKVLSALGYELPLTACPECGAVYGKRAVTWTGSLLACERCAESPAQTLSVGAVRTLRAALDVPVERMGTLRCSGAIDREVGELLEERIVACLGTRPKSMGASSIDPLRTRLVT